MGLDSAMGMHQKVQKCAAKKEEGAGGVKTSGCKHGVSEADTSRGWSVFLGSGWV